MRFIDVLEDERGRELVEGIEELIGETEDRLVNIRNELIETLKKEFGYEYKL